MAINKEYSKLIACENYCFYFYNFFNSMEDSLNNVL